MCNRPSSTSTVQDSSQRSRRLFAGSIGGYGLVAASILYGLASIPIALVYLPLQQFGLWAVTQQTMTFLALVDLGFSSALARLLIDHKDQPRGEAYKSMICMSRFIMIAQGIIVLLGGVALAFALPGFISIPEDLKTEFAWLLSAQAVVVAAGFTTKHYSQILYAHHRLDIESGIGSCGFVLQLLTLWVGFQLNAGIFALVWASAAGWATTTVARALACRWLGLLPQTGVRTRFTLRQLREVFGFGLGLFGVSVGSVLVISAQALIIAKFIGLAEAGIWTVCTRPFTIMLSIIWRPYDSSFTIISEMLVRHEYGHFLKWFVSLGKFTLGASFIAAAIFTAFNTPFVQIWTGGRVFWPDHNNILLACWIPLLTISHCASWVIQASKHLRSLPWICLFEGVFFVASASLLAPAFGFMGVILCSIAASLFFTVPYSYLRLASIVGSEPWKLAVELMARPVAIGAIMMLAAASALFLTRDIGDPLFVLAARMGLMGLCTIFVMRILFDNSLRSRLLEQLPPPLRSATCCVIGNP